MNGIFPNFYFFRNVDRDKDFYNWEFPGICEKLRFCRILVMLFAETDSRNVRFIGFG